MEKPSKKDMLLSISILLILFLIELRNSITYYDMHYQMGYVAKALGRFTAFAAIPFLMAAIMKKRFWRVLWKTLIFIAVPIMLLAAHGRSIDSDKTKENVSQSFQNDYSNSEEANSYYEAGLIASKGEKHQEAINNYSRAIEIDPNFSKAYIYRSIEYLLTNSIEKAMSDCNKAIQLNPNLVEAYFARSEIHLETGNKEKYWEDIKSAARLGNVDAMLLLKENHIEFE